VEERGEEMERKGVEIGGEGGETKKKGRKRGGKK
jgi:hypothetical protein